MSLLDWVYPKRCLGCGAEGKYFCLECRKLIRHKGSSLVYEGAVRQAIKAIKYRGVSDLVAELVEIWDPPITMNSWVITSVPMWEPKRWMRGYNQAELIGRELAACRQLKYMDLLVRLWDTKPMYGLNTLDRVQNVRDVFRACDKIVMPSAAIIVDDVMKSGATMRECEATLIRAGVKRVQLMALAS